MPGILSGVLGLLLANATTAHALEFSGAATITTDYIYRGLSTSGGNPALQLGVDLHHKKGWFAGIWASTANLKTGDGRRHLEVDIYAGYQFQPNKDWSATMTVLHYTFPDASGPRNYDHTELLLGVDFLRHYSAELGYTNDVYGSGRDAKHWELRGDWPVGNAWTIGAGVGGNDLSDFGTPHYLHWDVGASTRLSRFTFDLRWHNNETPDRGVVVALSAESQLVLSISAGF